MRRVLFIAFLFPPIPNSGTRRSLSFVNRLPDHGWEPLVLTAEPEPQMRVEEALMHEVRPGTCIARAPLQSRVHAQRLLGWLPERWRERAVAGLAWRLKAKASIPDEVGAWFQPAVDKAMQLHDDQGFDAIYASGWPWTAFLIAQEVARRTGKPYVLDYRDCWISGGEHAWEEVSARQQHSAPVLQRRVAGAASGLVTTTMTFAQTIEQQLEGQARLRVIPNGFEPSDFQASPVRDNDGCLRVAYTGVWRPGYGLQDLYSAIAHLRDARHPALDRLHIDAAGFAPGAAQTFGVSDWVTEHGPVHHGQAVALMTAADALYLPLPEGFQGKAALAGKHFEYLGSGRPILASAWGDSETARLADLAGGVARVDPGDVTSLARVIGRCLDAVAGGGPLDMFPPIRGAVLQQYTRATTARQLADLLFEVTLQPGRRSVP